MEQREICRFKIGHLNRFEIEQAINTIVNSQSSEIDSSRVQSLKTYNLKKQQKELKMVKIRSKLIKNHSKMINFNVFC
jgi:hypothetical protein